MSANTSIRSRTKTITSHRWFTPWLLLGPAVIWVLVFALWPFLNTVFLSFTDARPLRTPGFVGGANYERMLGDEMFWNALTTCILYVVVCVPLLTILPLLLALLVQKKLPGIAFFRTTFYFPVIASVVVVALIWTWLFDSRGIINQTLEFLGVIDAPLAFLVDRWLLLGCAMLFVWMLLYYRWFGLVANAVLICNVVLIVALLSLFGASLTLPGIAGIVLTVGMAVDANILIYERMREELRLGNSPQAAIKGGFEKAFSAIFDANITTLIAGLVLFLFGYGPIKGFAVTLCVGILTTMFSAIVGSRAIISWIWGGRARLQALPV